MFCKNCGSKLEDGVLFCPKCGAPVPQANHNEWENVQQNTVRNETPQPDWNQSQPDWNQTQPVWDQPDDTEIGSAPSSAPQFIPQPEIWQEQEPPRGQKPAKEKKAKKAKKSKLPLIILGVAAIVVAVVGAAFGMVMNSPKNVLLRGASNTYQAIVSEETGVAGYLGLKDLAASMAESKMRHTLSGEMDLAALDMGLPEGNAKVTVTVDTDAGKEIYLNSEISGLGLNWQLAELSFSQDTGTLLAAIPQLYDRSFYLDLTRLKEMAASGELFTKLQETYGFEMEEEAKTAIQDALSGEKAEVADYVEAYEAYFGDVAGILKNGIQVTKADARTFSVGGADTSCKGYAVTVASADLLAILDRTESFVKEDMLSYMESINGLAVQGADLENTVHEAFEEMRSEITEDLQVLAYIGPQKRLAAVAWKGDLTADGETASLDLTVWMTGAKNPADDMGLTMAVANNGSTSTMKMSRKLTDTDAQIMDALSLSLDGEDIAALTSSLDKNSGDWNVALSGASSVTAAGKLQDVKKGESFAVTLTDLEAESSYDSFGILEGEFAGSSSETVSLADYGLALTYRIEPVDALNSGSIASMERLDVLSASAEDFQEVSTAIQNNVMGLVMQLMGAVGFGGF